MAAAVWRSAWPVERLRQRAFFCFGMDVLLKLNLEETREFFAAFFSLSPYHWHGFLSARLGFFQLIGGCQGIHGVQYRKFMHCCGLGVGRETRATSEGGACSDTAHGLSVSVASCTHLLE
jgi:hypothetical protein